jgi:hypothetical protein
MRTNRASRRFKDKDGKFVFIRKQAPVKWVPLVHVRSYRHNEPMPEGFNMGMAAEIKVVK